MNIPLRNNLTGYLRALGVAQDVGTLAERLIAAWKEPHRRYHTLQHLSECLAQLEDWPLLAGNKAEVGVALWFHDAVYDLRASDNEERSAALAYEALSELGVAPDRCAKVSRLVEVTEHATAIPVTEDERVMVDIDLSILGAAVPRFHQYCSQVRQEYSWVPAEVYAQRRAEFLREQLNQPWLYHSEEGRRLFENQAKSNLRDALRALGAGSEVPPHPDGEK